MCEEVRFGVCPQHGPLPSMRPSTSLSGPKSYAISTFPDEVGLCISSIPMAGYGVFARHFIPMGTWIGPYEGRKLSLEDGFKIIGQGDAPFLWEVGFCHELYLNVCFTFKRRLINQFFLFFAYICKGYHFFISRHY